VEKSITACRLAIKKNPESADFHRELGDALRYRGRIKDAIAAYRHSLKLNKNLTAARYFLAALGGANKFPSMPPDVVVEIFDEYAENFDIELVQDLKYQAPPLLSQTVQSVLGKSKRKFDVLDVGCGTGLCGPHFHPLAKRLDGVDLSPKMVAKAKERGLYNRLVVGDLCDFLESASASYDLVIATDVTIYFGSLQPIFSAAYTALRSKGWFGFTIECHEGSDYSLTETGRYVHAGEYIKAEVSRAGFLITKKEDCVLRLEDGKPVKGAVYVISKE